MIRIVEVKIIRKNNETIRRRTKDELNPKAVKELTDNENRDVVSVQPYSSLHNSAADRDKINGVSLPEKRSSIEEFIVEELKDVIICRGGSLTGKDRNSLKISQLMLQIKACTKMEKEKPSSIVYFDRSRCNNEIFSKIDASKRRNMPQVLTTLAITPGFEPNIHAFFVDLLRYFKEGKHVDGFGTIVLEEPEITEALIFEESCNIGDSKKQKNIAPGLKKILKMDDFLYHAMSNTDDGTSILIVSK